ncbi:MAG: biopolymer transporter ExbD [Paludibacteraceae bacterium]
MNLQSENESKAEVFTATMNDIMFFLMLFFLIVSTLLNPNIIKLNLPSAQNTQSIHKKEIQVSVDENHQYYVNNKQILFDNLEAELATQVGNNKSEQTFVVLRCANTLPIQEMVNVLEIGNKLDIKMVLATQKK